MVDKDFKKNILIVSNNENDLLKKDLIAEKVNWVSIQPSKFPLKVKAQIRYRHVPASAMLYQLPATNYKLVFAKPQRAITPGQSVVWYQGEELLGGGVIS